MMGTESAAAMVVGALFSGVLAGLGLFAAWYVISLGVAFCQWARKERKR